MPTSTLLSVNKNQKGFSAGREAGFIHFLPLFLLLAGLAAGVYLVQHPQIFKPKATDQNINFTGTCVASKDGNPIITCNTVQIKFTSPLETGQTSDGGSNLNISLVKPVYAAEVWDQGKCDSSDPSKIFNKSAYILAPIADCPQGTQCISTNAGAACGNNGIPVIEGNGWSCNNEGKIHKDGIGFEVLGQSVRVGDTNIECSNDTKCTDLGNNKFTCGGGQTSTSPSGGKPSNISPKGTINVSLDSEVVQFFWSGPSGTQKYRFFIDKFNVNQCGTDAGSYGSCFNQDRDGTTINHRSLTPFGQNVDGGKMTFTADRFRYDTSYTWWVDALDADGNKIGTSDGTSFTVHKTTTTGSTGENCTFSQTNADGKVHCYFGKTENGVCKYNSSVGTQEVNCQTKQPISGAAPAPGIPSGAVTPTTADPRVGGSVVPPGSSVPGPASAPADCRDNPINPPSLDTKWIASCNVACSKPDHSECPRNTSEPNFIVPATSNWCYGFGPNGSQARCMQLKYIGGPNGKNPCTSHTDVGTITSAQANCVIDEKNRRIDVLGYYDSQKWCISSDTDRRAVINDWYKTGANAQDKQQISSCGIGGTVGTDSAPAPAAPARVTKSFRYAETLEALKAATNAWIPYDDAHRTVTHNFDTSLGLKHMYVQFMDNQNTVITLGGADFIHAQIELMNPIPANTNPAANPAGPSNTSATQCTTVTMNSGNGNPGGNASLTLAYSGSPSSVQVWMASNDEVGKNPAQVTSWTNVLNTSPSTYLSFTIPANMAIGSHAVMVSLYDASGSLLDGNPGNPPVVNTKCTSFLNVQVPSVSTTAPTATQPEAVYDAKCSSVTAGSGTPGGVGTVNVNYTGRAAYLEVWMSEEVGIGASQVQNWKQVKSPSAASIGSFSFNIPSDTQKGSHAIMVALRDVKLSMLDGNPNSVVNPACAASINIQ